MATKCTMFFTAVVGSRAFGWTESHYRDSNNLVTNLTALFLLAVGRAKLLGAGVFLPYLRVSAVDVFRDSQVSAGVEPTWMISGNPPALVLYNPMAGPTVPMYDDTIFPLIPAADKNDIRCDFPYSGLLIRLEANPPGTLWTTRSSLILRGSPDIVQYTLRDSPKASVNAASQQWLTLLTGHLNVLTAGDWGFMGIDPLAAKKNINSFTWANNVFTLTSIAHGYSTGDEIRISGTELVLPGVGIKSKAMNGIWTVGATTSDTFTLIQPVPDYTGWVFNKRGFATRRNKVYAAYTHEVDRRWAERKTGGPFDRPIGRRRRAA